MQSLSHKERRLLYYFLAACAVCVGLVGMKFLGNAHNSIRVHLMDLRERDAINKQWLVDKPLWDARAKWIADHPAPKANPASSASELLSSLQSTLSVQGAKIAEQSLSPIGREGPYSTVNVHLKITGPFQSIAKWLFEMQKAESYLGIHKITFKSDSEPPLVVCDLEITQYIQNE
ncbi:MAG: GspMb/PilO family protein [Chthoniobacterales bacterium]